MLTLGRKVMETVVLLKDGKVIAEVTLIRIKSGNTASIGFEADKEIKIIRKELLDAGVH